MLSAGITIAIQITLNISHMNSMLILTFISILLISDRTRVQMSSLLELLLRFISLFVYEYDYQYMNMNMNMNHIDIHTSNNIRNRISR